MYTIWDRDCQCWQAAYYSIDEDVYYWYIGNGHTQFSVSRADAIRKGVV